MKGFLLIVQVGLVAINFASARTVSEGNKRLIQVSEKAPAQWMTETEIFELIQSNKGFMDITDFDYSNSRIKKPNVHGK